MPYETPKDILTLPVDLITYGKTKDNMERPLRIQSGITGRQEKRARWNKYHLRRDEAWMPSS